MKKSIFTLLLVGLVLGLQAKPVDVETAKSLGVKFMNVNTEIKSAAASLVYTELADNGEPCFYVFSVQPKGFVIVSADDRAKPILGYSTESAFSDELPEGLESFFRNYQAGFSQMFANNDPRTAEAVNDWERLAATGKINNAKITREVPKLLTCTWNQSALYNRRCPEDEEGPDGHVYAGCVATAMAQIMYYWQWPHTGTGMNSYNCHPYGTIAVSFESAHYHYELMPDFLDWTSAVEEVDAVALLMYHAGASVDMQYSPNGSGAYSFAVNDALGDHFKYDAQLMRYQSKNHYTESQWGEMLRENLDGGMPLYYSASGNDGGHAFVCDGYDENDMFHFNWGWQGFDNGYYATNALFLSHYSFPYNHDAIFNIVPDGYFYSIGPQALEDVVVEAVAEGTNRITFTTPSMTLGEWDLPMVDSVIFMRNNEIVHVEYDLLAGSEVSFEDSDAVGIDHYALIPYSYENKGPISKDTILNGPTCELNFHLHDSVGDGWITKAISIVDSHGIAIERIGLAEGSDATVTVDVPANEDVTIHWAYTIGGKDGESYFEIYGWDGRFIYATDGKPTIGELCSVYVDCSDDVAENEQDAVEIYPNPTHSQIVIEGIKVAKVEVYNALGQKVTTTCEQTINLSAFEAGMYFLRIESVDGKVSFEKVLKR